MKGHLGAVITSGLAAMAMALALLQAMVIAHGAPRYTQATASHSTGTNRYSVPGGRSGIPFVPFERAQPADPARREGGAPQKQEQHRSPPPPRMRAFPPQPGPQPQRKLTA